MLPGKVTVTRARLLPSALTRLSKSTVVPNGMPNAAFAPVMLSMLWSWSTVKTYIPSTTACLRQLVQQPTFGGVQVGLGELQPGQVLIPSSGVQGRYGRSL